VREHGNSIARTLVLVTSRHGRRAGAAVTVVVILAACGSTGSVSGGKAAKSNGVSSKPPAQVIAAAQAALRSVRTFVLSGTIAQGSSTVRVKLTYGGPSRIQMQVNLGTGKTLGIILLPAAGYFRPNRALASHPRFANRWDKASASAARKEAAGLGDLAPETLASQLGKDLGALTRGGRTKLDGIPAIIIHTAGASRTSPGTVVVAATGPAYPLRITGTCETQRTCAHGEFGEDVTLSDFNNAPAITAPRHALN
jgi:hypothetical protein